MCGDSLTTEESFTKKSNRLSLLVQNGRQEKLSYHYGFLEEVEKTAPSPGTARYRGYINAASDQVGMTEQIFTEWFFV